MGCENDRLAVAKTEISRYRCLTSKRDHIQPYTHGDKRPLCEQLERRLKKLEKSGASIIRSAAESQLIF